MKVTQPCPTLCDSIDYTVHGILQARILEWVAFRFSRKSFQPRDQNQVSHIAGGFFTSWAMRETLYAEYVLWNAGLDEAQAGIKTAGRNINDLRYAGDTTLMAESKEEPKSLLIKMKGQWKSWLKTQHSKNEDHSIWSHHFMANRWGKNETVTDFLSWAPKSMQMLNAAWN